MIKRLKEGWKERIKKAKYGRRGELEKRDGENKDGKDNSRGILKKRSSAERRINVPL